MKGPIWLDEFQRGRFQSSVRNPGFAALMSFFIMGLGQVYAGHVDRGILLLAIQAGGIFTGYSIYSKGIVYNALIPTFQPSVLIIFFYFISVILVLIWIFNVKDAYYLSLFAGFRDSLEVEKVMAPMITHYQNQNLLTHRSSSQSERISHDSQVSNLAERKTAPNPNLQEETVITIKAAKPKPLKPTKNSPTKSGKKSRSKPDIEQLLAKGKISSMSPWIYVGIGGICILAVTWYSRQNEPARDAETTLLALTKDLENHFISASPPLSSPSNGISTHTSSPSKSFFPPDETIASFPLKPQHVELSAQDYFLSGMELLKKGFVASGVEQLEIGLKHGDARPEVWKVLLKAYRETDQMGAFEDALKRFLIVFPLDSEGWVTLGKLQYDRQLYVEASRSLTRALGIIPTHVRANYLMGCIYRELGMPEDAIPCLMKALGRDPLNPEFHREIGKVYMETKDFRLAKRHFEKALSVEPRDEVTRDLLSEAENPFIKSISSVQRNQGKLQVSADSENFSVPKTPPNEISSDRIPGSSGAVVLYVSPELKSKASPQDGSPVSEPAAQNLPSNVSSTVSSQKLAGNLESAKRSTAGDEPGGFTPHGEAGRMPPFIEKISSAPEIVLVDVPISKTASPAKDETKPDSAFFPVSQVPSETPYIFSRKPEGSVFPEIKGEPLGETSGNIFPKVSSTTFLVEVASEPIAIPKTSISFSEQKTPQSAPNEKEKTDQIDFSTAIAQEVDEGSSRKIVGEAKETDSGKNKPSTLDLKVSDPMPMDFKKTVKLTKNLNGKSVSGPTGPLNSLSRKPLSQDLEKLWIAGQNQYLAGHWEEALPFFLEYLKKREDPRIYECLSHIFERMGMQEDAFEAILRASQLGPVDSRTLVKLGRLAEETKRFSTGCKLLEKAVEVLPHRVDLKLKLANCLKGVGDIKGARTQLLNLLEDPRSSYAIKNLVESELAKMPSEKAITVDNSKRGSRKR